MFASAPPPRSWRRTPPEDEEPESKPFYPADLPKLEKDPFGWTPEELKQAVETAHKWRSRGE